MSFEDVENNSYNKRHGSTIAEANSNSKNE